MELNSLEVGAPAGGCGQSQRDRREPGLRVVEALNQNNAQTLPEQVITNLKVSTGKKIQAMT
jgi:hypothetical protein